MYQNILVPVDGSPTANLGLDEATKLARLTSGHIRLVHVIDELSMMVGLEWYAAMPTTAIQQLRDGGQAILDAAAARVRKQGVEVDTALIDNLSSRVADQVLRQAAEWPAELIVIGTHGRRGLPRLFMGSDAEQIVRLATMPVLLVRGAAPA
jgi:nucleotide-binding universal stress UspA family protein